MKIFSLIKRNRYALLILGLTVAVPLTITADPGYNRLREAIFEQDYERIVFLLQNYKIDLNSREKDRDSLINSLFSFSLHEDFRFKVIQLFIAHGADIESRSSNGYTPFQQAVMKGDIKTAEFLHVNHAEVEARWPFSEKAPWLGMDSLHLACEAGLPDSVRYLIDAGFNVDSYQSHSYPLFRAVSRESVEIVKILLDHGADVSVRNINGKTPLEYTEELLKRKRESDSEVEMIKQIIELLSAADSVQ